MGMPVIAGIYARKSKYSDKGDSVENQIQLAREYLRTRYGDGFTILIYEDEGYSGGTVQRPAFQRLLKDIEAQKLNVLICYKLDRISRSVSDFSGLLSLLTEKGIDFISIKESFDTASPMGRAMVYICSVFAQLERETIAERIQDNLLALAKSRRYLYATAPYGYAKKQETYYDKNGVIKHYNLLEANILEQAVVENIFMRYEKTKAIGAVQRLLEDSKILNRSGKPFSYSGVKRILSHPIYCRADRNAYDYFSALGCRMMDTKDSFTGNTGIYVFRRSQSKGPLQQPEQWHIGVGSHRYFIASERWIKAQKPLKKTPFSSSSNRNKRSGTGLLNGILTCSCGAAMRPFSHKGSRFYYTCTTKETSRGKLCAVKNIRGDLLDTVVQAYFREKFPWQLEENFPSRIAWGNGDTQLSLANEVRLREEKIRVLVEQLARDPDLALAKHIKKHIQCLDEEINTLNEKLNAETASLDNGALKKALAVFAADPGRIKKRRNFLQSIVEEAVYDGETLCFSLRPCQEHHQ